MNEHAPPENLLTFAGRLIDEGRSTEAIRVLDEHLMAAPADDRARHLLGVAKFRAGDLDGAEQVFRAMASRAGANAMSLYCLGMTLEQQGRSVEARHWVGAAVAADPSFVQARDHLVRLDQGVRPPPENQPAARAAAFEPGQALPRIASQAPMASEFQIPADSEQLERFAELRLAKARKDFAIDNWLVYPLAVRAFLVIAVLCIVAWGGLHRLRRHPGPRGTRRIRSKDVCTGEEGGGDPARMLIGPARPLLRMRADRVKHRAHGIAPGARRLRRSRQSRRLPSLLAVPVVELLRSGAACGASRRRWIPTLSLSGYSEIPNSFCVEKIATRTGSRPRCAPGALHRGRPGSRRRRRDRARARPPGFGASAARRSRRATPRPSTRSGTG